MFIRLQPQHSALQVDQTDEAQSHALQNMWSITLPIFHHTSSPLWTLSPEQHVQVLAATQRNVDNSVSKTCNGAT